MDSFIIIMVVVIVAIGIGLMTIIALTRKGPTGLDKEQYRSKWLAIESSVSDDEGSLQLAIFNADKLLDAALKARGFKGDTMGERMKNARTTFRNNDAVWSAHKLRNRIAHEEIKLNIKVVKRALGAFKNALKDVGAL